MKIFFRSWKQEKKRRATRRNLNKKIRENYKPNRQPPERDVWGRKIERHLCSLMTSQDELGYDLSLKSAIIIPAKIKGRYCEKYLQGNIQGKGCYAFFDKSGNCLYVGKSNWLHSRTQQHRSSTPFFNKVKTIAYWVVGNNERIGGYFPLEIALIGYYKPKHNKATVPKLSCYGPYGEEWLLGYFIPPYCAFKPEYLKSIIAGKN